MIVIVMMMVAATRILANFSRMNLSIGEDEKRKVLRGLIKFRVKGREKWWSKCKQSGDEEAEDDEGDAWIWFDLSAVRLCEPNARMIRVN